MTEIEYIAQTENKSSEELQRFFYEGKIVILGKASSKRKPVGIGFGLRTKINANIGTSPECSGIEEELEKLKIAIEAGADTVMDLSTGGDLKKIRKEILNASSVPIGTVPIYQTAVELEKKSLNFEKMEADHLFDNIEEQAQDGVEFMTIHAGITLEAVSTLIDKRLMGIVSRGGSMLARWMQFHQKENPLYEQYDRLLDIVKKYDVVLSLGDGLRPGCIEDATDEAQIRELNTIGELVKRGREKQVQIIVEGPGHVPLNQIEMNVRLEKEICKGAPFYVLGPLVTDIAPGYDHITGAIGGAVAAAAGADFLCYVTPTEHLGLPDLNAVREGVIAFKIAAHAGDIAKGIIDEKQRDKSFSAFRKALNWEKQIKNSLDPQRAAEIREQSGSNSLQACSMCGEFCSMK